MTYGGDLFTQGHAWRRDGRSRFRCKWCGVRYSLEREGERCKGKEKPDTR